MQSRERIDAVDILRGFALLGILALNIVAFAWPFAGYENPHFSGGADGGNTVAWYINSLLFSGKMMSLFSMLFGAGLVLMAERAAARGSSILGTYYRRILWLFVIGLIHANTKNTKSAFFFTNANTKRIRSLPSFSPIAAHVGKIIVCPVCQKEGRLHWPSLATPSASWC